MAQSHHFPPLPHDGSEGLASRPRHRPPTETLSARRRPSARDFPDRVDIRSAGYKERLFQFHAPGCHSPAIRLQCLRNHDQPASWNAPHRPFSCGMALALPPRSPRPGREASNARVREKSRSDFHPGGNGRPENDKPSQSSANAIRNPCPIHTLVCQEICRDSRCLHSGRSRLHPRDWEGVMKVQKITLREIRMPLVTPFETSFGRVTDRRMLLVEADVDGVTGWGESVAGEGPFYAPETVETAWHILRDFIWLILKDRKFTSASEIWNLLAPIRGHNMAKGAIESAV